MPGVSSTLVCVHLGVICTIAILIVLVHYFVPVHRRGFYCDDEHIRYKFRESTVPSTPLAIVGGLFAVSVFASTELSPVMKPLLNGTHTIRKAIAQAGVRLYNVFIYFFIALLGSILMNAVTKHAAGRLRPHFMDVCRPTIGYNCTPSLHGIYIKNYDCRGSEDAGSHDFRDTRLSFYSGHASFSFLVVVFLIFYLEVKWLGQVSTPVLRLIQLALIGLAVFVGASRVFDHHHHFSDVLVGATVGSSIAVVSISLYHSSDL